MPSSHTSKKKSSAMAARWRAHASKTKGLSNQSLHRLLLRLCPGEREPWRERQWCSGREGVPPGWDGEAKGRLPRLTGLPRLTRQPRHPREGPRLRLIRPSGGRDRRWTVEHPSATTGAASLRRRTIRDCVAPEGVLVDGPDLARLGVLHRELHVGAASVRAKGEKQRRAEQPVSSAFRSRRHRSALLRR